MKTFGNNIRTFILLFALTGLIIAGGKLIGGNQGMIIALGVAAVMNFVSYFFSDKIAIASVRAEEVGPDHPLYRITARLASKAQIPMPRVYISPAQAPNAFATGRNPQHAAVCATQGLLEILDEKEISGVIGHELSHVRHRDILIQSVAATIAGAISVIGYMMWWGGGRRDENSNPLLGLLFLILAPVAAGLIQMAISRQREFAADTGGAELCGDPMYLASALEKLDRYARRIPLDVNPSFNNMFIIEPLNPMRSMANLFATHPPLEARLENLIGRPTTGRFA